MATTEHLGWRDERISRRHRLWGVDCPAADLDHLHVYEYDDCEPAALIEYKHAHGFADPNAPSARALLRLGERAGLPVLFVRYHPESWHMHVVAGNDAADEFVPPGEVLMTEGEYVSLLHRLRGREAPGDLLARLNAGV